MSEDIDLKRHRDLEDNIRETLDLIKEYEDKLRLSDDPKERRRCQVEIEDLKATVDRYQQELEALGETSRVRVSLGQEDLVVIGGERSMEPTNLDLDFTTLVQVCAHHLNEQTQELAAKYVSQLYVHRETVEEQFKRFTAQSEKNCFLVLGKSGSGKTNILCYMAQKYSKSMPVIFLRGTMRIDRPNAILERVAQIIGLGIGQPVDLIKTLQAIDECVTANDTYFLIFIDGINEARDLASLKEELHVTLQICSGKRIWLCVSCRDLLWSHFEDDFWPHYVYSKFDPETATEAHPGKGAPTTRELTDMDSREEAVQGNTTKEVELGVRLEDFSERELDIAIEKYFLEYEITADIVERARQRCRHPLLLRIFTEANQGESFGTLSEVGHLNLMEAYWNFKVRNIQRKLHHANTLEAESLILTIAKKMLSKRSPLLSDEEMREVTLAQKISLESPLFVALLDEDILMQEEISPVTRERQFSFFYDEFLEYSLGRLVFTQHSWLTKQRINLLKDLDGLVKVAKEFYNIISAVEYASLMLEQSRGDSAHIKLLDWLSRTSIPWRLMTARCITKLEHSTEEWCYGLLRRLIQDPIWRVRVHGAWALGLVGRRDPEASLRVLENLIHNGPIFCRDVLPVALIEIIQVEQEQSMELLKVLSYDQEAYVRRIAALSLAEIAENASERSLKLLDELASDKDWWVRRAAASSLSATMQVDFQKSMVILSRLARDERTFVRWAAAHSLAEAANIHPDYLVETLKDWIKAGDLKLREAIALALRDVVSKKPDEALSLLGDLAKDGDPEVRQAAAYSLSLALQQKVKNSSTLLHLLAMDDDHTVRRVVAYRLDELDTNDVLTVVESLVSKPLRFTLLEILAFTLKWLVNSFKDLLHFSFNEFVKSSEKVGWGLGRFAWIDTNSVQEYIARSSQHYVQNNSEQGVKILSALARHQSTEIRKLVAHTLGQIRPQPSVSQHLLEYLIRDPIDAVRINAQKSLLHIQRQERGKRRAVAQDGITGALLGAIVFVSVQLLMHQQLPYSSLKVGLLSLQNIADIGLAVLTTLIILALLRILEGFGRKQVGVGLAVGSIIAVGLLYTKVSIQNAITSLIPAFLVSVFYYDFRRYFDNRLNIVIGYYAVLITLVSLVTLLLTLILRWISVPDLLASIVLGATSGLTVGVLRNLDENLFWRVWIQSLMVSLILGALLAIIIGLFQKSLYSSLTSLPIPKWTDTAYLVSVSSILGVLVVALSINTVLLIWGERYRGAMLMPALAGSILGYGFGIVISNGSLILFGFLLGFAIGGLAGLLRTCWKYRWRSTILSTGLLLIGGIIGGGLSPLLVDHQVAMSWNLLAGVFCAYVISTPGALARHLFNFRFDEFDRLD